MSAYPPSDDVEEPPAGIPADVGWRVEKYLALGLDVHRAVTLAEVRDPSTGWFADWHRFAAMVAAGCAPKLAFDILA